MKIWLRNLRLVLKKRVLAVNIELKKIDTSKAQSKNVKGGKKGTRRSSVSWCNYLVESDTLEGLAPVAMKKPKVDPRDTTDIPASNPEDPIDLESSLEPLVKKKAGKRKQVEVETEAQPSKKVQKRKIGKRGNLDAFIAKPPPEKLAPTARVEPSSAVNDDHSPSPPRASIREQLEGTKAVEDKVEKVAEVENPEVEKPVEVEVETEKVVDPENADVDITQPKSPEVAACDPEKGKSICEDPVPRSVSASAPVNIEKSPAGDRGSFSYDEENSPIRPGGNSEGLLLSNLFEEENF
ncbi:hypothetical protein Hdeb2414_s0011g00365231 [Helianthus debilis subsp. tardiflorus]